MYIRSESDDLNIPAETWHLIVMAARVGMEGASDAGIVDADAEEVAWEYLDMIEGLDA